LPAARHFDQTALRFALAFFRAAVRRTPRADCSKGYMVYWIDCSADHKATRRLGPLEDGRHAVLRACTGKGTKYTHSVDDRQGKAAADLVKGGADFDRALKAVFTARFSLRKNAIASWNIDAPKPGVGIVGMNDASTLAKLSGGLAAQSIPKRSQPSASCLKTISVQEPTRPDLVRRLQVVEVALGLQDAPERWPAPEIESGRSNQKRCCLADTKGPDTTPGAPPFPLQTPCPILRPQFRPSSFTAPPPPIFLLPCGARRQQSLEE
jgi:hypothetical protein